MHTPLVVVPGHEVLDNSEHVTSTPVVADMLDTGPVTVVENFDATDRHWRYAKKSIIYVFIYEHRVVSIFSHIRFSEIFLLLINISSILLNPKFCSLPCITNDENENEKKSPVQYSKSNSIPDVGTLWLGT